MEDHEKIHRKVCVPKALSEESASSEESSESDETTPSISQDSPLLRVPEEVLLQVCRSLQGSDLVRLGWVCHSLRVLCRNARAWRHVKFPGGENWSHAELRQGRAPPNKCRKLRPKQYGVLRVAPALHTLTVSHQWPPVNLLRCTNNVKVFEFEWEMDLEDEDKNKLYHTIRHYRHHLEKVKVPFLEGIKTFRLIDGLTKIQELYVGNQLVKVYPGSEKTITSLTLGWSVSGKTAAEIIKANRDSLSSFSVDIYTGDNLWMDASPKSAFCRALRLCTGLRDASIPTWGDISIIDSFPLLRSLTIFSFGKEQHLAAKHFFEASRVVRGLHKLSLHMGQSTHRGLIQVVACSCAALRDLGLLYVNPVSRQAPRDLHVILGRLGDLERLTLSSLMVPCSVFRGLAAGSLPNLAELTLDSCLVTNQGRAALEAMQAQRQDLAVVGTRPKLAQAWLASRCTDSMCQASSDCDEDDPV
ncbi:uncharacterized protein LOC117651928 [Thrips palmi]|uniref:Uncharacterized protein LOC117651928 n=1 Tax=Thrips palmi TaxID=161013 RepID=A0A6P9A3J7_THRPL|nr:uncharacterized protein LOC117651928 [Thrips palmi]